MSAQPVLLDPMAMREGEVPLVVVKVVLKDGLAPKMASLYRANVTSVPTVSTRSKFDRTRPTRALIVLLVSIAGEGLEVHVRIVPLEST